MLNSGRLSSLPSLCLSWASSWISQYTFPEQLGTELVLKWAEEPTDALLPGRGFCPQLGSIVLPVLPRELLQRVVHPLKWHLMERDFQRPASRAGGGLFDGRKEGTRASDYRDAALPSWVRQVQLNSPFCNTLNRQFFQCFSPAYAWFDSRTVSFHPSVPSLLEPSLLLSVSGGLPPLSICKVGEAF